MSNGKKERQTDLTTENKLMVTRGEVGGTEGEREADSLGSGKPNAEPNPRTLG